MEDKDITAENLYKLPMDVIVPLVLSMKASIDFLTEQLKLRDQRDYGRKTEKMTSDKVHQLEFAFNEAEAEATILEPEPTIEEVVPTPEEAPKKKKTTKKAMDLKKITNHREEVIDLSVSELEDIFGKDGWKRLPYETITKLEHVPACFEVVTYLSGVYASKDGETIVRAKRPVELWDHSIATPSLVASIIFAKYVNAVPLYRQEKAYQENDINLSRTTMANWVIQSSDMYFRHVYDKLKDEIKQQDLLHADETPFEVNKDGRKAGSKSYMWVYRTGEHEEKKRIILYDYRRTRSHEHPQEFLDGFKGTLVCDGYSAYHQLERENPDSFTVAGCWTHVKRKFATLVKATGGKQTLADEAVKRIQRIYHEDNQLKELSEEERLKKRKEIIAPLVDEFFTWAKTVQKLVAKESATGQGITYALNQEKYLRAFLENPRIPLDNNSAERAIRPFTLGRKNWVMIDTVQGAQASAVLYSIVETCKANNLKIYEYLRYLLEELPKTIHDFNTEVPDRLLPWSDQLPSYIYKSRI